MPERSALLTEIVAALPEIMRRLLAPPRLRRGEWELTIAQARALGAIAESGNCTMGQLARTLGTSLGAATELADRLVQQRLIERADDPADRRLVLLRPAAAGKRARAAFMRDKRRRLEDALRGVPLLELKHIARSLALLRSALSGPGAPGGETRPKQKRARTRHITTGSPPIKERR